MEKTEKHPLLELVWGMLCSELFIHASWRNDNTELVISTKKNARVCVIRGGGVLEFDKSSFRSFTELNTLNQVRKVVDNAREKQVLLQNAESVTFADRGYSRYYLTLASFRNILFLHSDYPYGGPHYYVWERDAEFDDKNIIYSYDDAKKEFARRAGLLRDSLDFTELHAIYQVIRYYRENGPEREPVHRDVIEKVQRHLLRACPAVDTGDPFPSYLRGEETDPFYDGDYDEDDDGELNF